MEIENLKVSILSKVFIGLGIVLLSSAAILGVFALLPNPINDDYVIDFVQRKAETSIVVGKPVKWVALVEKDQIGEKNLLVELPKTATGINVRGVNNAKDLLLAIPQAPSIEEKKMLAGISFSGQKPRISVGQKIAGGFGSFAASLSQNFSRLILEDKSKKAVNVASALKEKQISQQYVLVEYETPAPEAAEKSIGQGKEVTISADDQLKYTDILAYTKIPEIYGIDEKDKIKVESKTNPVEEVNFDVYDLNKNGLIDYVEWTVPHLSTQIYEVIYITKAFVLDEQRNLKSDIYSYVESKDGVWSGEVNPGEYVKASFFVALNKKNDITLFAKSANGQDAKIEVYSSGGNKIIAVFEKINSAKYYKVFLSGLKDGEKYEAFDLKISGAPVLFDYIIDPSPVFTVSPVDSGAVIKAGDNATFSATGDVDTTNYYLAICNSGDAPTAASGAPPTCASSAWCISEATADGSQASCSYATTSGDEGDNAWYAFVCDDATENPTCSAVDQGSGSTGSPFTVDASPPNATSYTVGGDDGDPWSTNDTTPEITVVYNENATCRAATTDQTYTDMSDDVDCAGDGTTSISCQMGELGEGGSLAVYVACTDDVGNEDSVDTSTDLTNIEIDATKPTVSNFNPADSAYINDDTPAITFDTDETADCYASTTDYSYADMVTNTQVDCTDGTDTNHSCAMPDVGDDGSVTIYISCKDDTDSVPNQHGSDDNYSVTYTLDTSAPTTSDDFTNDNVWVNSSPQTITLTPNCDVSGCAWTKYCTDSNNTCDPSAGTDYSSGVEISTEGTTYFRYASSDNAGNTQSTVTRTVKIDASAPTTSDDYENGENWNNSNVTITLTPNCAESGCSTTYYCQIEGCESGFASYGEPVLISNEGTNYFRYRSSDNANNTQTIVQEIIKIDKTAPTTTDDFANNDVWVNSAQTITLTPADAISGVASINYCTTSAECTPDQSYSSGVQISTEGISYFRYQSTDNAGNAQTIVTKTIKIDTSAPTTSDDFTNDNVWVNSAQTITLTPACGDSGCEWTKYCLVESCDPSTGTDYSQAVAISTQGTSYFRYASKDNAGNTQTTVSKTLKIDTTNPTASFASPTPDNGATVYNTGSFAANVSSSDNLGEHSVVMDFNNSLVGWWKFNTDGNNDDSSNYNNHVTYVESGGWTASGKYAGGFSHPVLQVADAPSLNISNTLTVSGWIKIVERIDYEHDIVSKGINWSGTGTNYLFGIGFYGKLKFSFRGEDSSANIFETSAGLIALDNWYHVAVVYDSVSNPIIYLNGIPQSGNFITGGIKSMGANASNLYIGRGIDWVFYGTLDDVQIYNRVLSSDEIAAIYNGNTSAYNHTFSSLADGTYTIKAYSQDLAGNSATQTRTITLATDSTPPAPTVTAVGEDSSSPWITADSSPLITLTLDENGDCYASTDGDETYAQMSDDVNCTGDGGTSISCQMGELDDSNALTVYIACQDENNSADDASTNEEVTIKIDSTGPTNVGITSITADSTSQLTITGNTATDAGSGLANAPYWFDETTAGTGATDSTEYQASATFVDTGLSPNTQYTYRVKAKDSLDNVSEYSSGTSKYTLANVPTSLTASAVSTTQIYVSFGANSNPAGTQYYVENTTNSANSGWTTDANWTSGSLTCGTSYTFKVKAKNGDGTETEYTDTVSATTSDCAPANPVIPSIGGGGSSYTPTPAAPTPPAQGFSFAINNGSAYTNARIVALDFNAGSDTALIDISTSPNFSTNVIEIPYKVSYVYDLCRVAEACPPGIYTVYVKFLTSSGGISATYSKTIAFGTVSPTQQIKDQFAQALNQINSTGDQLITIPQQISELQKQLAELLAQQEETPLDAPPIEESVPQETPVAFTTPNALPPKPISDFILTPLPSPIVELAQKFPDFGNVLAQSGVERASDLGRLRVSVIKLPDLSSTLAIKENTPLTDLTDADKQRIPSEVVFAKTSNGLLDLNTKVIIDETGNVKQNLNMTAGQQVQLIFKTTAVADSVKGKIVFKNRVSASNPVTFAPNRSFIASLISIFTKDVLAQTIDDASQPYIEQFDYRDTGGGVYAADINFPAIDGQYDIKTIVSYKDTPNPKEFSMTALVDPEGYIYENINGNEARIKGAEVTLFWLNPQTQQYEVWPAQKFLQTNPQTTDKRGSYSFLVSPGYYYLQVSAPGYKPAKEKVFQVTEGSAMRLNIEMKPTFIWLRPVYWESAILALIALLFLFYKAKNKFLRKADAGLSAPAVQ